ncbi:MAG: type II toxin-antitoxin system VapC family toxin [Thermoplasmatota archaeon]
MNYIDSNVFIYPLLYQGKKADSAKKKLSEMVDGDSSCATSSLTLDEVMWVVMNETNRKKALQIGKDIMTLPNLKILDVTNEHILQSITFMEKYKKLKPRDAIHLAVCTTAGIFRFITDDADFDHISEINRISLDF